MVTLKTSVTRKMPAKHATVERHADGENAKTKPLIVASKSPAVTYIMTCESASPRSRPTPSATTPTTSVSMTTIHDTWRMSMPSVR